MSFVDKLRQGERADMKEGTEAFGFSQPLLQKGMLHDVSNPA